VQVLFLNPGTDTAPVQEAVLALGARGLPVPRVVLCLHEVVALAAAHGFYAATGRPQAVMVHVDVGTQNLGSMVHNAARAEAGVVILAGRTPYTAHGELTGGRDSTVHWWQDVPDQAAILRQYVKHAGDLASPETLVRQVHRAFQLAAATPAGPVYLTAAREALMAEVDLATLPADRYAAPAAPAPDRAELRRAAAVLARVRRPVIVTSRVGRDPEAPAAMAALAERLNAPVVETRERVNLPSAHPHYLAEVADARAALAAADAVLVVDAPVPWVPASAAPPEDAFVVVLDADPLHPTMPAWSYAVDVALQCDPVGGLRDLLAELGPAPAPTEPWWRVTEPAPLPSGAEPVTAGEVAAALAELLDPEDIVVEEATTNAEAIRARLPRTLPGTYVRSGGSGLGWALGACLGIKLAEPGRRVACLVGDGAFLFGEPPAALWAMQEYDAPSLVVVLRNGGYAASRRPVLDLFPDGESVRAGEVVGTLFADHLDLAALAASAGAFGGHVRTRDELAPLLRKAWEAVAAGQAAVVVVEVSSPWI
jgi:acetolactate synthase I/II/III large subunit